MTRRSWYLLLFAAGFVAALWAGALAFWALAGVPL